MNSPRESMKNLTPCLPGRKVIVNGPYIVYRLRDEEISEDLAIIKGSIFKKENGI